MRFRRNLPALRFTIFIMMIHVLVVLALPIFLGAFFGATLPGNTPTVLAAFIPVLYIGSRLVKNHRLDRPALFVLPLLTINLVWHAAKGQPLMIPLLLTGVGLAWVNALLRRLWLPFQAWATPPTFQKSPPLDGREQHQPASMPGGRLLPLLPFLIDVLALTLFLVALGQVLFVSFLPGLSVSSLLFFHPLLTWGVVAIVHPLLTWGVMAIAVLLLIGYGVWHQRRLHVRIRSSPFTASHLSQRLPQGEKSLQERGRKSTIV